MTKERPGEAETCGKCRHFSRCQWLVGAKENWAECDWYPSRFSALTPEPEGRRE